MNTDIDAAADRVSGLPAVGRGAESCGVVHPEDQQRTHDRTEELADPVGDQLASRDALREPQRQAEHRVGDGTDDTDRDRDRRSEPHRDAERPDVVAAQDDQSGTTQHHDQGPDELGRCETTRAGFGHVDRA